jgi:hypothetical protein
LLLGLGLAACSSPDPSRQPARFVVVPRFTDSERGTVWVGVAWIPPGDLGSLPVSDAVEVPSIGEDFAWALEGPPPAQALRGCTALDCDSSERAAIGWIVAFTDGDADGTTAIQVPSAETWTPADLLAEGADRLVGIATDHVAAFSELGLAPARGLAQRLGWPVPAGPSVMRVERDGGEELLEPVVSRERVPIYLLAHTEAGLCCDACGDDAAHCPSFQGQGDQVD